MADQGGGVKTKIPLLQWHIIVSFPREEIYTSRHIRTVVRFCSLSSLYVPINPEIMAPFGGQRHIPGSAHSLQPGSRTQTAPTMNNKKVQFCADWGLPDGQAHGTISFPRSHPIFQRVLPYWELWDGFLSCFHSASHHPALSSPPKSYLLWRLLLSCLTR